MNQTESIRQRQVAELIKRNFSMVLTKEGSYIYGSQALVSVMDVKMSPDLGLAKIYVSIWNADKEEVMIALESSLSKLRQSLIYRIRKQVRRVPEIYLYVDDTLDEMKKLNDLFDNLH